MYLAGQVFFFVLFFNKMLCKQQNIDNLLLLQSRLQPVLRKRRKKKIFAVGMYSRCCSSFRDKLLHIYRNCKDLNIIKMIPKAIHMLIILVP